MKKKIEKSLLAIGFEKYLSNTYKKDGLTIKVFEDSKLEDVFSQLIDFGSTQKIWQFKRVMQISDSY